VQQSKITAEEDEDPDKSLVRMFLKNMITNKSVSGKIFDEKSEKIQSTENEESSMIILSEASQKLSDEKY
jgi:hypothetical protein